MSLIPVADHRVGNELVKTCSARDLHKFLAVGKTFAAWINDRIEQYGFRLGFDFEVYSEPGRNPVGGRPAKEYAISIDMAKELSMVERNEKGKQARQYFLECERRAKNAIDPIAALGDATVMRGLLLTYTEKVISLEKTVAEQAPQVATLHRIAAADGSLCMRDAAKALQVRPLDLRRWLVAHGWIYQRPGHSGWLAYQERIQQGAMCHKVTVVQREDGSDKIVEQVRITPKGIARIGAELAKAAA